MAELMVATSAMALLLAFLLPAISAAREASRRIDCISRLAQLGKGVLSHESHLGRLPANSWRVNLLPYIELQSLSEAVRACSNDAEAREVLRGARIGLFICPSESAPNGINTSWSANYVACYAGTPFPLSPHGPLDWQEDGMFPIHAVDAKTRSRTHSKGLRLSEVVDGLSSTAMLSEIRHTDGTEHRLRRVWYLPQQESVEAALSACESLPREPAGYEYVGDEFGLGHPWFFGDWGHGLYNHVLPPNRPSCHPGDWGHLKSIYTSASLHPKIVNLIYADGRCESINESVDSRVWRSLGSCNETLSGHD
jgi:hypothetical protein